MRKGRDREISRRASIRLSRSAKAPITCVHNVEILTCFGWMATRFNSARRAPVRTTTCGSERGRGVERGGRRGQIRETTTLCFTLRTSCGVHEAVPLVLEFSGTSSVRTSDSSSAFDSRFAEILRTWLHSRANGGTARGFGRVWWFRGFV